MAIVLLNKFVRKYKEAIKSFCPTDPFGQRCPEVHDVVCDQS